MRLADGLPELAGTLANDMRKIVDAKSLLFPATYGASVTRIYPPKWAARAIPHAGGCDYYGLADQHRLQWIIACKGVRALKDLHDQWMKPMLILLLLLPMSMDFPVFLATSSMVPMDLPPRATVR